jgi:large subunit ribosomal protein L18
MCIFRTPRHIYAQIIDSSGSRVLASASTVEADVKSEIKNGGNIAAAAAVGKRIAEKAKAAGVDSVAFDRSGFRYHGRIKALADAAREGGLQF